MINIYFEQNNELEKFLCLLQADADPLFSCEHSDDRVVTIHLERAEENGLAAVARAVAQFILHVMEDRLLLSIISGTFYYNDEEEQQQILQLAHSFLEGERHDYRSGNPHGQSRETLIMDALVPFLKDGLSFSLASFVTFRLKPYIELLSHYVELAIDEYKLEQEYQTFVQLLRDYVAVRETKWSVVHLVHRPPEFFFFDEQFRHVPKTELKQWIDRKLVNQPMYIDSTVLAPLVSLAPKTIYVYTDEPDDGMLQTLQNVFQERLRFCPSQAFQQSLSVE
ncbi:MAG: putative sporulation protein YtxC [Anoxybacillus sp.]|nr:putative sporulation protein YtxC [Anoxybacillus sp.]MCL6586545.1 putative sporulation protein YtxC [Anoxybacillus sp.]